MHLLTGIVKVVASDYSQLKRTLLVALTSHAPLNLLEFRAFQDVEYFSSIKNNLIVR